MHGIEGPAQDLPDEPCELENGVLGAPGDVVGCSEPGARRTGGQEVGPNRIFDKGEVPALAAVAKNRRGARVEKRLEKAGNHGGVRSLRTLPGTIDIKVT